MNRLIIDNSLRRLLRWRGERNVGQISAGPYLPPQLAPQSALMDACRTLRISLMAGDTPRTVLLAGFAPDRALLLAAAGLALAFAETASKTVLVDANMRNPMLHMLFQLEVAPGLAETLVRGAPAETISLNEHCALLPAGHSPAAVGMLARPGLDALLDELNRRYATQIYALGSGPDAPDMLLLAPKLSVTVIGVRQNRETAEQAQRMHANLERAGATVAGFVLLDGDAV